MSDKYRSNYPMSVALDQLIVQFLEFVTTSSDTTTITDANGNPISITSLGSAAGTGVPASAVVAISNKADDAFAASTAASGLAASASSDAASAISITTGYQSAIDSAVAASNSATGAAQQAESDALGASGYAGQAYNLAQTAQTRANTARTTANSAYSIAYESLQNSSDTFIYTGDNPSDTGRWYALDNAAQWTASQVSSAGSVIGSNVLQVYSNGGAITSIVGGINKAVTGLLPMVFDPARLYRIRARLRVIQGGGTVSVGVATYDVNGNILNVTGGATTGPMYHTAADSLAVAVDQWYEVEGYIQGSNASAGGAGNGAAANSIDTPAYLSNAARYIAPYVLFNDAANGTAIEMDYFTIDDVTGYAAALGASGLAAQAYNMAASGSAHTTLPLTPSNGENALQYPSGAYIASTADGTQIQTSSQTVSGSLTVDSPSANSRVVNWKVDGSAVGWMSNDGTISTEGYITFVGYKDKSITTSSGDLAFYNAAMTKVTTMDDDGNWSVSSQTPLASGAGSVVTPLSMAVFDSNQDFLQSQLVRVANGTTWGTSAWRIQRVVDVTTQSWIQLGYGLNNDLGGGAIGNGSTPTISWDGPGNVQFLGKVLAKGSGSVIGSLGSAVTGLTVQSSGSAAALIVYDPGVNGANLNLKGNGVTTPNKSIRANGGKLEFINSAYSSVVTNMDDNGNWTTSGNFTGQAITANNGFNVGTLGPYIYVSDANGSVTLRNGLTGTAGSYRYFTFNYNGDLQILNGNISAASSITLNGKSFTVDGAGNLAFAPTTLYNASGVTFSLATNGHYWNFNADGSMATAGNLSVAGTLSATTGVFTNTAAGGMALKLVGDGTTNQNKWLRVSGGQLQLVNSANTAVITSIDDIGTLATVGELQTTSPNALRMVNGNYGVFWRQDGASLYLMKTASGGQYGTWDASRPFIWNYAGGISSDQAWTFSSTINVTGTATAGSFFTTWPIATGTIANGGGGGNYGFVAHANNNGGSSATSCAAITFIRDGLYGCYFGIDTDNVLKIGGWSAGNVAYRIHHDGLANPSLNGNLSVANGNGLSWAGGYTALVGTGGATLAFNAPTASTQIAAFQLTGVTESYVGGDGTYQIVGAGGIRVGYNSGTTNSIDTSGWFRSSGNSGWFNASYGIGVYAIDATYVRTYNNAQMVAADFVLSSDRRLKARIRDFEYRGRLRPVNYFHLVNGADEFGFISQEVQELYPEIVGADPNDGMLNLSYEKITAILSAQLNRTEDDLIALRKEFDEYRASRENTLWKRLVKCVAKFLNIK